MTIEQYNKYKSGEITLTQIKREHMKIDNRLFRAITNRNLLGILGLELIFAVQVLALMLIGNDANQMNDVTVDLIQQYSEIDVKELMKEYLEIARI
jgi:hypothetical protein